MTSTTIDRLTGLNSSAAIKVPCVTSTVANIALSGLQTINSVVLAADDRVFVGSQTDQTTNGVYLASTGVWQRVPDFDDNRDVVNGTVVYVAGGAAGTGFYAVTTANPVVIGTSNITFAVPSYTQIIAAVTAAGFALLASPIFTGNPRGPTPTPGDNDTSFATTAFVVAGFSTPASVATAVAPATGRNRVINGNFAINQRAYVSATATASGTYMHDRWKSTTAASAYTFTQAKIDTQITITAGTIAQVIEDVTVEGGVYTLSWGGTATARIAINGAATSGAFAASPITTASATAGQKITIEFSTGTLGQVQLEPGASATAFSRDDFITSLNKCLRYYRKSFPYGTAPAQNTNANGSHTCAQAVGASLATTLSAVRFGSPMRAAPTVTLFNPNAANAQVRNATAALDFTASSATFIEDGGFTILATSAAASTAGQTAAVHWTAEADL